VTVERFGNNLGLEAAKHIEINVRHKDIAGLAVVIPRAAGVALQEELLIRPGLYWLKELNHPLSSSRNNMIPERFCCIRPTSRSCAVSLVRSCRATGLWLTAIEAGNDDYCRQPAPDEAGAVMGRTISVPMLRRFFGSVYGG
jgi:hypothetical protein